MSVGSARPPTLVLGIGNPLRSDDGVGPAVIDALAAGSALRAAGAVELAVLDGEPTRLVAAWDRRELVVIVDAVVSDEPPGTVHRLGDDLAQLRSWSRSGGTHGRGLAEALALGQALDRMPERMVILGVAAAELALGPALSPPVAAALPVVMDRVRREVAPRTQASVDHGSRGRSGATTSLG